MSSTMISLPQPNLKAKDLPQDLLPHKEILAAYQEAGQEFKFDSDASGEARVWNRFWPMINGNVRTKNQNIEQQISGLYRVKDKGKEWLTYHILLIGSDHKGEQKDFPLFVGKVAGIPIFEKKLNPDTEEIETGAMIHDHKTLYQIPFTKEKVKELEPYFTDKVGFTVIDRSGKRHSCSLKEFMDMD